ncbi:MAG TPA: glycosyl hydrolase family 28 protein [Terriglobia bacterium]|nr:glycosyl hydrolase family 28 protein [Terriglobia bacterium]
MKHHKSVNVPASSFFNLCNLRHLWICSFFCFALILAVPLPLLHAQADAVFNVRNYGATGSKAEDAKKAIQSALDACANAGGGTVLLPAGDYTSGTLHLRSHVRLYIASGATLFGATEDSAFDTDGLLVGEDLDNITIEGRGTINGQAEYDWRMNVIDDGYIRDNQKAAEAAGVPLMRSFPKGMGTRKIYPHMIKLLRCRDVRIAGLSILDSPSWTIYPYACQRLRIDGVYIHTDQKYAVWADGIDPDGCEDVIIANSTIETGDDAIVFYSSSASGGPPKACQNITITNCRLSSSSSAIKFCDGNSVAVRNVTISNCVITHSNRGIAFMVYDGGVVENVVIANVVIETNRFDWFWWGNGDPIYFTVQRRSESLGLPLKPDEAAAGAIRHVILRNIIAHGQGSCLILGHPDSWLDDISLENIKLFLSTDPSAPYDRSRNAMQFRYARNLKVKDVEVNWNQPELHQWQSALYFQDVGGLKLEGFAGAPAKTHSDAPAVVFDQVEGATIVNSEARPGTRVFLKVTGARSRDIHLRGNQLHDARPYQVDAGVKDGAVKEAGDF